MTSEFNSREIITENRRDNGLMCNILHMAIVGMLKLYHPHINLLLKYVIYPRAPSALDVCHA